MSLKSSTPILPRLHPEDCELLFCNAQLDSHLKLKKIWQDARLWASHFSVFRLKRKIQRNSYVDLIVIHLSCSSFRVSVNRVSPALAEAMMPALHTKESVKVDLPWSTWAITDIFLILDFLSMIAGIWPTVKFTWMRERKRKKKRTAIVSFWSIQKPMWNFKVLLFVIKFTHNLKMKWSCSYF